MNETNKMVSWNQMLSFSPLLAKCDASPAVFWPGCAAMKLGADIIGNVYAVLQLQVPQLGFSSICCANPTFSAGSKKQKEKRTKQLERCFAQNGVKTVYVLCPNCKNELQNFDVQVVSAWEVLAQYAQAHPSKNASAQYAEKYILHDPCAGRKDTATQEAVRAILNARQIEFEEFAQCRERTQCCGRKDMLFLREPEVSQKMLHNRVEQANGLPIITYCESCVEAFKGAEQQAHHVLEILFDKPARRSFVNRIKNKR